VSNSFWKVSMETLSAFITHTAQHDTAIYQINKTATFHNFYKCKYISVKFKENLNSRGVKSQKVLFIRSIVQAWPN
jgi:hypothetical protein